MATRETLQALVERQLIHQMVRTIILCDDPETRERDVDALRTFITYADPSLDVSQIDGLTRMVLQHLHLWDMLARVRAVGA
jgi:hypothetical protein